MNQLQLQTGAYRTTFIGTEIIRESTQEEWYNYGEILRRVDEAKQWAIGDWLRDGKHHYGDGLYEQASEILDLNIRTLQDFKQIADRFEITLRNVNLSYNHHREVASIKQIEENEKGKLFLSENHDMIKANNK